MWEATGSAAPHVARGYCTLGAAIVVAIFFIAPVVRAQSPLSAPGSSAPSSSTQNQNTDQIQPVAPVAVQQLPTSFAGIALGSSRDQVIAALADHPFLFSDDEPEVSFLPSNRTQILEVVGKRFITKAQFRFDEQLQLTGIKLYLDGTQLDYFTVYRAHETKYGRAQSISPARAQWDSDAVSIIIEKPLQVSYVAKTSSAGAQSAQQDQSPGSARALSRQETRNEFLSLF